MLQTSRSGYEVTAIEPGKTITLRDVRTGTEAQVEHQFIPRRDVEVGELVCCHLLPWPEGYRATHFSEPLDAERHAVLVKILDAAGVGPVEVVAVLSNHPLDAPAIAAHLRPEPVTE
ncbi:MAG: hypothetical protein QM650_10520 [Microlunatus sp.]